MNNTQQDNFIFETILIDPISKIISDLKNDKFGNNDIKWINNKLETYTNFALKTLGKSFLLPELDYIHFNVFVKNQFLNYFNTLLKYFKNL